MAASRYRIVLRGRLSERFESAFDGMTLEHGPNRTVLVGDVRDQAQLYGLLDRLQEFGIELLAVEPADISDGSSDPGTGLLPEIGPAAGRTRRRRARLGPAVSLLPVMSVRDGEPRAIQARPANRARARNRGRESQPPEPAEVVTADLLRSAGVTVTGVDIDELDTRADHQGRRHGRALVKQFDLGQPTTHPYGGVH